MAKKRCWTFNFICLNEDCKKNFVIKLEMTDKEALEFSKSGAYCKECTKKKTEEEVKRNMEKYGTPYASEDPVEKKVRENILKKIKKDFDKTKERPD